MGRALSTTSQQASANQSSNTTTIQPGDINCEPQTETKVGEAIRSPKNNKATGTENIPAEIRKTDINTSVSILQSPSKDLGTGMYTIRVEGWNPGQNTRERPPQLGYELQRNHASVYSWESTKYNYSKSYEECRRRDAA